MASYTRSVMTGFGWVALAKYANRILGFVTTLILAKFLAPEDFGVVAVAMMVIEVLRVFKDMGLNQALIYKEGDVEHAAHTAFITIVGMNIGLCLLTVIGAPFAARFFDEDMLTPVIVVLASNLIWISIKSIPEALIRKGLGFKKLVAPEIIPVFIASIIAILMAYEGYGVWSLVARTVIVNVLGMFMIWRYTTYRPRWRFEKAEAVELFGYGKYIVTSSALFIAVYNIDQLYVSKISGLASLGMYALAMRIANLPVGEFGHVICNVIFPIFSKMGANPGKLGASFLRTMKYMGIATVPMALGLATYGPSLVDIFYGEKWIGMAEPLQILSIYALFRSFSVIIHETFKAIGKPKLMQDFVFLRLVLIGVLGIPALHYWGLLGMCYLVVGAYLVALGFEVYRITALLEIRVGDFLRVLVFPFAAALACIPGIFAIFDGFTAYVSGGVVVISMALSIASYGSITYLVQKSDIMDIRRAFFSRG